MAATPDTTCVRRLPWCFWSLDWADVEPGTHTITWRAIDQEGNVQPSTDDPFMSTKITYWESNGQIARRVEIA